MNYLSQDHYLDFLHTPKKQGEDFTHIANLQTPSGTRKCYVKIYPDNEQSLLNEIIGYLYAKGTNIPSPNQAGLIELTVGQQNADLLHKDIPEKHNWIKKQTEAIGWWTTDEQAPSINAMFGLDDLEKLQKQSGIFYKTKLNKLISDATIAACKKKHLGSICAFDHIFANIDRNLGNILFGSQLIAIDHGKILGSNHWQPNQLPKISQQNHTHKLSHLLNNVLNSIPDNVKMRAIAQFDSTKQFSEDNSTKQVLEFIQEFEQLDPKSINKHLSQYLKHRLSEDSNYKNSFGMLI